MDDGLKQRLIGAIVLMAVGVLFLPSLFDRDTRRSVDLRSQIPPEPSAATEMISVPDAVRPENIPTAKPLEQNYPHEPVREESPAERAAIADAEPEAAKTPVEAPVPVPTPRAPELNAQGVPEAWSLQVASFQSAERATAFQQELQDAGYQSYIREARAGQNRVHRVFVGPKVNKADAAAEKQAIDKRFKTDSLVVEFGP